jgi:hypothetical protein
MGKTSWEDRSDIYRTLNDQLAEVTAQQMLRNYTKADALMSTACRYYTQHRDVLEPFFGYAKLEDAFTATKPPAKETID